MSWFTPKPCPECERLHRDINQLNCRIHDLEVERETLIRQARVACHQAKTDAEKRRAHEAIGQIAQVPLLQPAKKIVPFKPPTLAPKSRK